MTQLNFKGIVRSMSPQNNAEGACEEIINLRLRDGSWRAVGKKQPVIEGVDFERVYVHRYGAFENFIGTKNGKVIWFASREGGKIVTNNQEICNVSGKVEFNQLNNILLIKSDDFITKAVFEDEAYNIAIFELPDIPDLGIVMEESRLPLENDFTPLNIHTDKYEEMQAACEMIRGLINKEKSKYPDYMEGYVFLCTTYQLFDGTETKPSTPILVKVGEYVPGLIGAESEPQYDSSDSNVTARIRVRKMGLYQLRVKVVNDLPEEYRDMITKVNVYATPVRSFYDMDKIYPERVKEEAIAKDYAVVMEKELKPEDVEKLLFFRVGSVDAMEKTSEMITVKYEALTTNETMPVDASGWINTTGNMFVYNNRLHLYNTRQKMAESRMLGYSWQVRKSFDHQEDRREMAAFVYLKVNGKKLVMRYDCACTAKTSTILELPQVVTFPDSRAYQIDFYDRHHDSTPVTVKLKPSATYNFAFGFPEKTEVLMNVGTSQPKFPAIINQVGDTMNLIVSEAVNPYYFPPEHSYLMPGEIINLSVNTEQISTSQVGQFPLYVFTTEGIYALQVGEGKVLYSNVIPISAEVAVEGSDVLQTKYGVIFVTDKGLKLISGQEVIDFSEAVDGAVDMNVRNCQKYVTYNNTPGLYNILPYLSTVSFSEYSRKAVMVYNIIADEVIVSNPGYNYSYVFNLKTNTWHKITEVFSDFNRYLGLQSYKAGAVSAKARILINCSVSPGQTLRFTSAVRLPELTFNPGVLKVSIGVPSGNTELFTCEVDETVDLVSLLGEQIDVPEQYFKILPDERKVYTTMPYTALVLEHPMYSEAQFYPFVAEERDLPVASEGVGETFSVELDGREFSHVTDGTETTDSIGVMIGEWVKSLNLGYEVEQESGSVLIVAQQGSEGNNGKLTCTSSSHVLLNTSGFSGGGDISNKQRVCDIRQEQNESILTYLQTRPLSLGFYGFTKLRHTAIRGEFKPAPGEAHGFFLLASDNLITWKGVLRQCFMSSIPHVVLPQNPYSFRYFVIAGGGYASPGHALTLVEFEGENKFANRLR